MATTELVKEALNQFLAGNQPGVFAIKGAWGVGKTYFWHDYVKQMKPAKDCRAYSYVSLFGITSVAELRRAIFTRASAHGDGGKALLTTAVKSGSLLLKGFKGGAQGVGWGLEGTDMWSDMLEEHGLKNFLVCIDDLERKEEDLSASALIGFITSLRDERKCRVVLLYNDGEIGEKSDTRKIIETYREKVFDRELTYQPTVADSYGLVFGNEYKFRAEKDRPSNPFHATEKRSLLEIFETAKTANIRVMRKAKDLLDYCAPRMSSKYKHLWPSFARQVVKACCLHYIHSRDFKFEYIADGKKWAQIQYDREAKERGEHKKYAPVSAIGYFQMKCDALILDYFQLGYIDWPKHAKLLAEQEKEHERSRLSVKLGAIWDLIWDDFAADRTQFCRKMNSFLDRHAKKLSLGDLSHAVEIVKELGDSNAGAEALLSSRIDDYVANNGESALMHLHYGVVSEGTATMIRQRVEARVVKKSIAEVVEEMSERDSFTPGDEKHLKDCSEEDFHHYMKTTRGPNFLGRLNTFKDRIGNDEIGKIVRERFEKAMTRLWEEDVINRRRLRYGVKFVPPGADSENVADKS